MGFFSWITQDTKVSLNNIHSYQATKIKAYMSDDKGNFWFEPNYDGYGVFAGKDYYELLAEMNGKTTRDEGIDLDFKSGRTDLKYPNINENYHTEWKNERPTDCPYQGYFY